MIITIIYIFLIITFYTYLYKKIAKLVWITVIREKCLLLLIKMNNIYLNVIAVIILLTTNLIWIHTERNGCIVVHWCAMFVFSVELAEVQTLYRQSTEHAAEQGQLIKQLEGLHLDTQRVLRNQEEAHTADTTSYQKVVIHPHTRHLFPFDTSLTHRFVARFSVSPFC